MSQICVCGIEARGDNQAFKIIALKKDELGTRAISINVDKEKGLLEKGSVGEALTVIDDSNISEFVKDVMPSGYGTFWFVEEGCADKVSNEQLWDAFSCVDKVVDNIKGR